MFGHEEEPPFGAQAQTDLGVPGMSQQPAAAEAGAPQKQGPPKSVLKASLGRAMGFARQASNRLTQMLPVGVAEGKLKALLNSYATIQENAGVLMKRLGQPDHGLVADIREFERQVQAFVEASELLLRENLSTRQLQGLGQTTDVADGKKSWLLWGAVAVGVAVVAIGIWYAAKDDKSHKALPARGSYSHGSTYGSMRARGPVHPKKRYRGRPATA